MPHFVVDCSENVLQIHSPEDILRQIFGEVGDLCHGRIMTCQNYAEMHPPEILIP